VAQVATSSVIQGSSYISADARPAKAAKAAAWSVRPGSVTIGTAHYASAPMLIITGKRPPADISSPA